MVLTMKRITIYGLKSHRKAILEELQRDGAVQVEDSDLTKFGFEKLDTSSSQTVFNKAITTANSALEILGKYEPEEKSLFAMFEGRETLSVEEYYKNVSEVDKTMGAVKSINAISKEISDLKAEIIRRNTQITALKPWCGMDVSVSFEGTKKTAALIGVFPDEMNYETLMLKYAETLAHGKYKNPDKMAIEAQVISSSAEQTCVFMLCHRDTANEVESVLRNMGFAKPPVMTSSIPTERIKRHENKIKIAETAISENENKIKAFAKYRKSIKFMLDYYTMRIDKYKTLSQANQQKHVFVVTGFIPEKYVEKLKGALVNKYDVAMEIEDTKDEDNVPVLLENNKFSAPVETVLETYSLPGKGEVDPTSVMAIFYYVLFGIMLSDTIYGLIMVLGCGFVIWKFKNIEIGLKKTMTMFMYCGISTMFWGIMFGGYFGDAITVISTTFFNHPVTIPPLWFAPVDDPMRMLVFSFALGIIHIFTGLGMKFYQMVKAGDWKGAIYDVVFWYMLVGGGVVYLLTMDMFVNMTGLGFKLSPTVGTIATISACVGALGIILFAGRSSKNPAKRVAKGAYELYNVTGYLSDILSYSRLLALGLATGVIAEVFNKMGSMFGGGIIGAIAFLIIFIIGHTLNIGINLLGAYVHTNRLQFVEFFGKFYEGGGEKYSPYSVNTKYYKFKEEI
ncbi:MAG: V-type ATP synthase subunit I [Oscillospiraceae bacterium]